MYYTSKRRGWTRHLEVRVYVPFPIHVSGYEAWYRSAEAVAKACISDKYIHVYIVYTGTYSIDKAMPLRAFLGDDEMRIEIDIKFLKINILGLWESALINAQSQSKNRNI